MLSEDQLVTKLRGIHTFPQLKIFLSEHMDWPVGDLKIEDITFDYDPSEIGLKPIHVLAMSLYLPRSIEQRAEIPYHS